MAIKNMAGIYLFNGNNILMMKRIKKDFGGEGQYYSIGGKLEDDELNNPTKCVLRELEEESGIKEDNIKNLQMKYIVFRNHKGIITQNYLFFAELINICDLKECNEGVFEWVSVADIFNKPLPASSKVCLEHYLNGGKDNQNLTVVVGTNKDGYGEYQFTELLAFDTLGQTAIKTK